VLTVWIGKIGHHGDIDMPAIFWGKPGLVSFLGLVGPGLVVIGILVLIFG
jgi:hypothetical protein